MIFLKYFLDKNFQNLFPFYGLLQFAAVDWIILQKSSYSVEYNSFWWNPTIVQSMEEIVLSLEYWLATMDLK